LNPFLWIFWLSALSGLSQQSSPEDFHIYVITFFSGTILVIFAMDLLKSYVGAKIKKYLKLRTQYRINRIVGISLILFGLFLLGRIFL
jgi:threonine/homoserine/homoserine lactone efflux protein